MKKIYLALFSVILLTGFTGCNKKNAENKKPVVICTTFPVYDWCRQILDGTDHYDLQLLNTKGADMHSFQPSVADMAKLSSADFLFYIGGESEKWIEAALAERKNKNQVSVSMLELLGERAKIESDEGIFEEEKEAGTEEEGPEYDEHVWLSVKNAMGYSIILTSLLAQADEARGQIYFDNLSEYGKNLDDLYRSFEEVLAGGKILLFADRYPFRYFADDYKITCYAAFPGCSAETEASFSTVIGLSKIVKEQNLKRIYVLENSNKKMAEQIINTAGTETEIKVLNSLQSVSLKDVENGATYIGLMEKNLSALW